MVVGTYINMIYIIISVPQINVDKFIVGRFTSHTTDGCPDGYMTIAEDQRSRASAPLHHHGTAAAATALAASLSGTPSASAAASGSGAASAEAVAAAAAALAASPSTSTGGQWCGTAWGYNVYYSEGSSINVSLLVRRLHQQQGLPDNFAFRLTYKVLRRADAKLRYDI